MRNTMQWGIIISIFFSVLATGFWLLFYYYYSPRFTTPRMTLSILLLGGMVVAGAVFFLERFLFSYYLSSLSFLFFRGSDILENLVEFFLLAALMFFVVAPIEELAKYSILRLSIRTKPYEWNQIIDGIKFGVVVGLGFATVENTVYFLGVFPAEGLSDFGSVSLFFKTVFLRFFTATLAHSLYSGMMGYFLGLSGFYRLYAKRFERRALFFPIILHGFYNTFLFTPVNFYSTILIIVFLLALLKWYSDRKNLETRIERGDTEVILPPFFSDRPEFESILAKNGMSYAIMKKLRVCPFCMRKDTFRGNTCSYCGQILQRT